MTAATKAMSVHAAQVGQTIGLGNTPRQLWMTDAEISRITATGGFTVGSSTNGSITIDGLNDASTDELGRIVLRATRAAKQIVFDANDSSFNKGITLQAAGGIILSTSVTTKNLPTVIRGGTGTFTMTAGKTLSTTNQMLTLTSDMFIMDGNVTTGTGMFTYATETPLTIGVGTNTAQVEFKPEEISNFVTAGMTIGSAGVNKHIYVVGIDAGESAGLTGITTLIATVDDSQVHFINQPSTFSALAAQADAGITVTVDLTTTSGIMYLDADFENDSVLDDNLLRLGPNITLSAKTIMTLESTTANGMLAHGALSFRAGSGLYILDHLRSMANKTLNETSPYVFNADYESTGDGTMTIAHGEIVSSNDNTISITAWDFDLAGFMSAGEAAVTIHTSQNKQTIGFGETQRDLWFSDAEVGRMTANGDFTFGSTTNGSVTVDGISDSSTDRIGRLTLKAMHTDPTAGTQIVFDTTSTQFNKGVTLQAEGGVIMSQSVTTKNLATTIYAGTGTLTLEAGESLSTTNQMLEITADDIDLGVGASVSSGTAVSTVPSWYQHGTRIIATSGGRTIGVGGTARQMHISDAELGYFTTDGGLTIGDSYNGDMHVNGITDGNSDSVGRLVLNAMKAAKTVIFHENHSNFNKGITIQSSGGVTLSHGITTKNTGTYINGGTGTITMLNGRNLISTNQLIEITTDDMDLQGPTVFSSGTAAVLLVSKSAITIGIGPNTNAQMEIGEVEFAAMIGMGLTLGRHGLNKDFIIGGVSSENMNVVGSITLIATVDDSTVSFINNPSAFSALGMQADNGVLVNADLATVIGQMYMDSDYENSSTEDSINNCFFNTTTTTTSKTIMTLESTTGVIAPLGSVTLRAGNGIVFNDNTMGMSANTDLYVNTDYYNPGDGTLTVVAGHTLNTNEGRLTVTAFDIDLIGDVNSKHITVHTSKPYQEIGLGTVKNMTLTNDELGRITASDTFTIGGYSNVSESNGHITVDLLTDQSTGGLGINGGLVLKTVSQGAFVYFGKNDTSFNRGVTIDASGGVILSASVTTKNTNSVLNAGTGFLTITPGNYFHSGDMLLTVTADELNLQGFGTIGQGTAYLQAGTGTIHYSSKTEGNVAIGLIDVNAGVRVGLDNIQMQKFVGSGLILGRDGVSKNLNVVGLLEENTNNIAGTTTLIATVDDSKVNFNITASTFFAVAAQADSGVELGVDVTASGGVLYFDGDFEDSAVGDYPNSVRIYSGGRLTAETLMTLEATTGGIVPEGRLTLRSSGGIVILDNMRSLQTGSSPLVINADYKDEGDGTLTIANGKEVMSNDSLITLTMWDIDLQGTITSENNRVSVHSAKYGQSIGLGGTVKDMQITDAEIGRITAHGGLTVGNHRNGITTIDGLTDASTDEVDRLLLIAQKHEQLVVFDQTTSVFNKGITIQTAGGVVMSASFLSKNTPTYVQTGTGTLTVATTISLISSSQLLTITADDVDFQGTSAISSGDALTLLQTFTPDLEIAVGQANKPLQLGDSELGNMITTAGVTVGDSSNGNIYVQGITDANSDTMSTLTLLAAKTNNIVVFTTAPSAFNKGIVVQTSGGIVLSSGLTTRASPTLFSAGTGTLTLASSATLSTTNQVLFLTMDDVHLNAPGTINTGTSFAHIRPLTLMPIGLGTTMTPINSTLTIAEAEFGVFNGEGLTLGCAGINNNIKVTGLTAANSDDIVDIVTLLTTVDDSSVTFIGSASTFSAIAAQADNGIHVSSDLTSTGGSIYLDGDLDNAYDDFNTVHFLTGVTTSAKTVLTLEATGSKLTYGGTVTLKAGTGIVLLDDLSSTVATTGILVLNADYDEGSAGTLTMTVARTINSNNSDITVTAHDIDLDGGMTSGTGTVRLSTALTNQQIGLGMSTRAFHAANQELQRITAQGGLITGGTFSEITVDGVTANTTNNILSIFTIVADNDMAAANFTGNSSTFNSLAVQADNGIKLFVDVNTDVASMTFDGDMDDSDLTDDRNQLELIGGRRISCMGLMTLDSTTGGIWFRGTGITNLLSAEGVSINDDVGHDTYGQPVFINSDWGGDGYGVFNLKQNRTITSNSGVLTLTASDIEIGRINSGNATTQIHVSVVGMTMGLGGTEKDVHLTDTELTNIQATGLNFGNNDNGSIFVDGIQNGGTIAEITSILATGHTRQVVFSNVNSTFNSLSVQADNGVTLNTGITSRQGQLIIDGDSDDSAVGDRKDKIVIAADQSLLAQDVLVLDATSGGIFYLGELTLKGKEGVMINDNMLGTVGKLTVDADPDASGIGTFTVATGKYVDNVNSDIEVTAADLDLAGTLTAGTGSISLHAAGLDRSVGIGATPKDLHITDDEVSRLFASGGFTLGDIHNGPITVNGMTDLNSRNMGRLTLLATKYGQTVNFESVASQFNKGITVQSGGGIVLTESVTTKNGPIYFRGGTGTLTIAASKSLSTTHQFLQVTIDDVDFRAGSTVSTGTASLVIATETAVTVGLGDTSRQFNMRDAELQGVIVNGLTIGCAGVNMGVMVNGITTAGSNGVSGILTLLTTIDEEQLYFNGTSSTFNALSVQADNGIFVNRKVTTTGGQLYMDGDYEDDAANDSNNQVNFTDGMVVSAKTNLILEATLGTLVAYGDLTMKGGTGMHIHSDFAVEQTGKLLTMNADYESGGDGTFTLYPRVDIRSNNGDVTITAADIDIPTGVETATIQTGTGVVTMHTGTPGGTLDLGVPSAGAQFSLSSVEIGAITSNGFILGNDKNVGMKISGVQAAHTSQITGIVSLVATRDDAQVLFHTLSSTFNSLAVQADNGVLIEAGFNAVAGPMTLDGDSDSDATDDDNNAIAANGDRAIRSVGELTLNAFNGGITRQGVGTLTLQSGQGLTLNNKIVSGTAGQPIVIYADDLGTGNGMFTINSNKTIESAHGLVTITSSDIDIKGSILTGTNSITMAVSKDGLTVGVGSEPGQFHVSGEEMMRVTSSGLTIGSSRNGSVSVSGILEEFSRSITGTVTLMATGQFAEVHFKKTASTFSSVAALADNGIEVDKDITTTFGSLGLNGDADETDDGGSRDFVQFKPGLTMTAETDIKLSARSGGIILQGTLTLKAKGSVIIDDRFTGPYGGKAVIIEHDTDGNNVGVLDIAPRACDAYKDCASCAASVLCGWCGNSPKAVGTGSIDTAGLAGTDVVGSYTEFLSSGVVVGALLSAGGKSRVVTSVTSDTTMTVDAKFTRTMTGSASVFRDNYHGDVTDTAGLDRVYGSQSTIFTTELKPGFVVTSQSVVRTVQTVTSVDSFSVTEPWPSAGVHAQFKIDGISGSGTISTTPGSLTVTGSWPPTTSRFLTEIIPGTQLLVNGVARTVASVSTDQVLTLAEAFPVSFDSQSYVLNNVIGTGGISFSAGSTSVTGAQLNSTKFSEELQVGDLVTVFGQTKLVQTIIDNFQLRVDGFFTVPFSNENFEVGTIHNEMFTIAHIGTGLVYSSGTTIYGNATTFAEEVETGYTVYAKVGQEYESRKVTGILHSGAMTIASAFSSDISSTAQVQFYKCSCPTLAAESEETRPGTFALHSKGSTPAICFSTGRCVSKSSASFGQMQGAGTVIGSTASSVMTGGASDFLNELKIDSTISVYSDTYQETRRVVQIISETEVLVDKPLSFTLLSSANQAYYIRAVTGTGTISNDGVSTYVTGTGTVFTRDVALGYTVALGNQHRVVTLVVSDTSMRLNAPFNAGQGGVTLSAFSYQSCTGEGTMAKTLTYDSCEIKPGCCGFKVQGEINPGVFGYYKIQPTHSNQDLRVVLTSDQPQVDLFIRRGNGPDNTNYDFRAQGGTSPWTILVPQRELRCNVNVNGTSVCEPVILGVKGLPRPSGTGTPYEIAAFYEMNFPSFACDDATNATLSAKCQHLGLLQLGDATVTNDATDPLNPTALRLTGNEKDQTSAVWWGSKVHVENGFETSFKFRISSSCEDSDSVSAPDECGTGDGFALVLYGGRNPDKIGCGGRSIGFASNTEGYNGTSGVANNCNDGIPYSFAVEFDTWHNPELHDVNLRGRGNYNVNATAIPRHSYGHVAFFSEGSYPNTANHASQMAGTASIPTLADGNVHQARLVYIPGSTKAAPGRMFLYIDDMSSFVLTAPVKLARMSDVCVEGSKTHRCVLDLFGNAYLGFTSATGHVGQIHDIRDWNFCDEPNCGR
jgi:hypothetical protein